MVYEISHDAKKDLQEIVRYTSENWGDHAVNKYVSELIKKLEVIGRGNVINSKSFDLIPDLHMTRFRYHLIYYIDKVGEKPQIVRILHHKQDKVRHLEKTLSNLN